MDMPMENVPQTQSLSGQTEWMFTFVALVMLMFLPFVLGDYGLSTLTLFTINSIILIGYRIIVSMGSWSFAHVAMVGVGAYTGAVLSTNYGLSFWLTLPLSFCVAGFAAFLLTFPILRTREYYFFLATFAAAEAIRQAFINLKGLTNGNSGIAFIPRPEGFLGLNFESSMTFYGLVLFTLIMTAIFVVKFDNSYTAKIIRAVSKNTELSESLGINTWRYKSVAFVLGSAIAGLAGALFSSYNGLINPSDFGANQMFKIVAAAIVGGTRTRSGPILGLIYLTAIEELFRDVPELVPLVWGVSVIIILVKTRNGLEEVFPYLAGRFHKGPKNA